MTEIEFKPQTQSPVSIEPTLRSALKERNATLERIAREIKSELFGIDAVIDRVIDSLRAWYLLPGIINRPVIVCLWGLTGTGKTQLTRTLARKLGFYDRFIEVQMDGFSNGASQRNNTVSGMLSQSGIEEGERGILVLDEFQRYRTIDEKGRDLKVERYQDVWGLLSDGRLAPSLSFMPMLESNLAYQLYEKERASHTDVEAKKFKLCLEPHEAQEFKQSLKLKEPLLEIMTWAPAQIQQRLEDFRQQQGSWESDYSKLLIFICGNLDEMYEDTARRVEDCDSDADIFHAVTSRLSMIDVKKALSQRFKPEQIARLGNNHVIYPSLSRATYQQLIASTCERYAHDIASAAPVLFQFDPSVYATLYANAVFPAQGTRPLFSSLHAILSGPLASATLWALSLPVPSPTLIRLSVDTTTRQLHAQAGRHRQSYPLTLELSRLKHRGNPDFRSLLAVHEAGHGLVYGLLFGQAPRELKINVASFEGGFNSYVRLTSSSRQNCLDRICVGLAGRAAETMVFGAQACTTGATEDLKQATAQAARFVRHFGFGNTLSYIDVSTNSDDNVNTDVLPTNAAIESLLTAQFDRAMQLLQSNKGLFMRVVNALVSQGEVSVKDMSTWLELPTAIESTVLEPYADQLGRFASECVALG